MKKIYLKRYKVSEDIFNKILLNQKERIKYDDLDKYKYGYKDKKTIVYNGVDCFICREMFVTVKPVDSIWKQVFVILDRGLEKGTFVHDIRGNDAWNKLGEDMRLSLAQYKRTRTSKAGIFEIADEWKNTSLEKFMISLGCPLDDYQARYFNKEVHVHETSVGLPLIYILKLKPSLLTSELVCDKEAFRGGIFNSAYLNQMSCKKIYVSFDVFSTYLTFLSNSLSELFTIHLGYGICDEAEYSDIDEISIRRSRVFGLAVDIIYEGTTALMKEALFKHPAYGILGRTPSRRIVVFNSRYCFLPYDIGETSKGYCNLGSSFLFKNLQKLLKLENICSFQEIDNLRFWRIFGALGLLYNVSEDSGPARTLKCKIIIINSLLGFDRLDEHSFSPRQIHFNPVKGDYYFTKNLNLSKVLEFKFITDKEKEYLQEKYLNKRR